MGVNIGDVHSLQTLTSFTSDVNAVDFAGDCILVTGSGDKKVRVWEWQAGEGFVETPFSPLIGHKYGVTCVKVSPQGTMLASSSIDGTTQLWNLRSGAKIHTMVQVGGEAVRVCKFSPDSSILVTAGDNGQVCLWDLVRRTLIRCFQRHEGAVQSVAFSPDSCWLLTSCTLGVLQLFSCNEIIESCPSKGYDPIIYSQIDDAHDLGVVCCDFSPIQEVPSNEPFAKLFQLASCGNDNRLKFWEVKVMYDKTNTQPLSAVIELRRVLERHSSALTCVRFSNNGLYTASSSLDKTAIIWEVSTGKALSLLTGHNRYVACCAFNKNGTLLATGSNDRSVMIWSLSANVTLESELNKHVPKIMQAPDREQELVKHAETDTNEVKLLQKLDEHNGAVNSVAMHGTGLLASGSSDKLVRIWSGISDESEEVTGFQEMPYSPIDGHKYSVNHVEFSPCGTMIASCSMDGTTTIWNVETGSQMRSSFMNAGSAVRVCRWSPDGKKIATAGDDEKTIVWDLGSMDELGQSSSVYEGHADAITALAFSPDSRFLVTACSEGTWRLFDTANEDSTESLIFCDVGHDLGVQGCDFSPTTGPFTMTGSRQASTDSAKDSFLLATCGNDSLIKLWKIIALDEDLDLPGSTGSTCGIDYKLRRVFEGHGGNVMSVRFAPVHGEILGSVATDRTSRIWSVHTGMCLHVLEDHESLITSCAFSEDTRMFATGALDKTVLIWKLPEQLVSQSILIDRLRNTRKKVVDWTVDDVLNWVHSIDLSVLAKSIQALSISGRTLLRIPEEVILGKLKFDQDDQTLEEFRKQLYWLKKEDLNSSEIPDSSEIPEEYLCPITHEVMREPVQCSDGFTYERAAIHEWFLCGKFTSPMTNETLKSTALAPNVSLRNSIFTMLHGDNPYGTAAPLIDI